MSIHIFSQQCNKIFPVFLTKIFPVLAPTSWDKKCIRKGKYFPSFLYQNFPCFRYTFYPHFRYPFYPRFRYPFYPRFRYPFLFPPFPAISTPAPDAAMRSCTVPCPQRQNRTQQRTIRMYSSPLVSGHKSSSRSWTRGPLFAL